MIRNMIETYRSGDRDARRAVFMTTMIAVQILCALFFIGDVLLDVRDGENPSHLVLEVFVATVLCTGLILFVFELRILMEQMGRTKAGLQAARGEMDKVIDAFFKSWRLTTAERDVALLILKGIDNENIARVRGRAVGTVRAQTASIYAKAGVDGRAQLVSVFVEELLASDRDED